MNPLNIFKLIILVTCSVSYADPRSAYELIEKHRTDKKQTADYRLKKSEEDILFGTDKSLYSKIYLVDKNMRYAPEVSANYLYAIDQALFTTAADREIFESYKIYLLDRLQPGSFAPKKINKLLGK